MLSNIQNKTCHDLPYWSFLTRKTERNRTSPHLSTHNHNVTLSHTSRYYTWRLMLPLKNAHCLLGYSVTHNKTHSLIMDIYPPCSPATIAQNTRTTGKREHTQHWVSLSLFSHYKTIGNWSISVLQAPDRDDSTEIDNCPRVCEQHRLHGPCKIKRINYRKL